MQQHNIVHTIIGNKKITHITYLYEKLSVIKLKDIYNLELPNLCTKFITKYLNFFGIVFAKLIEFILKKIRTTVQTII